MALIRLLVPTLFALLNACTSLPSPQERQDKADALTAVRGWQRIVIPGERFDLTAYAPAGTARSARLTVYIEGDGLAWITGSQPSSDPTPNNPLALRMALAQPLARDDAIAYLARPCQYAAPSLRGCAQRYWTNARFASDVIADSSRALDVLKQRSGAQRLTLVGYSGGGAVAALLAARRDDVDALITVAGNLDHRRWTEHHHVQPLTESLNPPDERARLSNVRQWHLVGERDKIIPPFLAQGFADGFTSAARPMVRVLDGYDHACCWAENWPALYSTTQDPPANRRQ